MPGKTGTIVGTLICLSLLVAPLAAMAGVQKVVIAEEFGHEL